MPFWSLGWDFTPKMRGVRVKSLMRFYSLTQAVLFSGPMGPCISEWEESSCAVILHLTRPIIPTQFHFIPKNSFCSKRNTAEGSCMSLDFIGVNTTSHQPEGAGLIDWNGLRQAQLNCQQYDYSLRGRVAVLLIQ